MLFQKKISRSCSYCRFAAKLDDDLYLCSKRGMRTEEQSCRKFRYDPLKRIPKKAKPLDFSQFADQEFTLDA